MAVTSTSIFQHANVEALMVTGSKPRFEILVDGKVKQVVPASRKWQAEQKAVVAAAQQLAGVAPKVEVEQVASDPRMAARLHKVASNFIARIGYSLKRRELTVVFRSGRVYVYGDVSMGEFNRFRRAHNVGRAFHAMIRGAKASQYLEPQVA